MPDGPAPRRYPWTPRRLREITAHGSAQRSSDNADRVRQPRSASPASGLRVIYLLIGVPLLWLGPLALASGMVKPGGAFTVVGGILGTGALTATRALDAERRR